MSGGQAIEHLAAKGDPHGFEFPTPMWKYRDCSFSFSGLKNSLARTIQRLEKEYGKYSQTTLVESECQYSVIIMEHKHTVIMELIYRHDFPSSDRK